MGILDDAIREHLDLKRKHGARDAELREIEDEALGSTDRPDPFAAGELYGEISSGSAAAEGPTTVLGAEALRPQEVSSEEMPETLDEPGSPPEGLQPLPGQSELPEMDEIPGQERLGEEPESYRPSIEREPESHRTAGHEPPSPSESLEDLIAEEEPFPEDTAAPPTPAPEPPAEEPVVEPEQESAVPDPPPPPPEAGPEPPGRARGRVDVPTQEHPPPGETGDVPPLPGSESGLGRPESAGLAPPSEEPPPLDEPLRDDQPLPEEQPPSDSDGPRLYDFETDEESVPSAAEPGLDDDFEALGPVEEESPYLEEEEPYAEDPAAGTESAAEPPYEESGTAERPALDDDEEAYEGGSFDPEERDEDEDGEEGLWFEKGPPKDFDFDD